MKKNVKKISLVMASTLLVGAFSIAVGVNQFSTKASEGNATGINPLEMLEENEYLNYTANIDSPDYVVNGVASMGKLTITPDDIAEYHHNGIKVDVLAAGTTIKFKNTFNVADLTQDTPLLDWMPLPEFRGTAEISQATIKVEDADDPDNYFCVQFTQNQYDVAVSISAYTQNYTNLGSRLGVKSPNAYNSEGTITTWTNFTGVSEYALGQNRMLDPDLWGDKQPLGTPFSIRYNVETKEVTHNVLAINRKAFILDLDDEEAVGIGKGFQGFTNDRVKVSLTIDKIGGVGTTSLMLYNVLGQSLYGESLEDKQGPNFFVSYPNGETPKAEVGKPYKIFQIEAYDRLCGVCESKAYVKEPYTNEYTEVVGEMFTPTKAGVYLLKYQSADRFGNDNFVEISIEANAAMSPLKVTIDELEKDSYALGDKVKIPDYSVSGGAGAIESYLEIVRSEDGETIESNGGLEFIPLIAGQYQIRYVATDYVGNEVTQVQIVNVKSTYQASIFSELNIPTAFVDGLKIKLPDMEVYDYYSEVATQLRAVKEVKVYGKGGATVSVGNDLLFTPSLETLGEEITVEYKIYCKNYPENAVIKSYSAKIVQGKYAGEYFSTQKDNATVSYNNPNVNALDGFIRFDAKNVGENVEIFFLHPVSEKNLNVNMEVEYAKKNFEKLNVKIFDAENKNIGFEFDIVENKDSVETLYVDYRGTRYGMNGGFNTVDDVAKIPMTIKYDNGVLRDYLNRWILDVTHNMDGTKFSGFPSGYAKICFTIVAPSVVMDAETSFNEIHETDGAALIIESIGGQIFDASYDIYDGAMQEFVDYVAPMVTYNYDSSRRLLYGDKFTIPYATASDIISPYVEVFVNVTSPSGQEIFKDEPMREGLAFYLNETGNYYIYYYAKDASGNEGSSYLNISITDDVAPLICLATTLRYTVKLNSVVTTANIPRWSIVDNLTKNVDVKIFVVDTSGLYHMLYNSLGKDGATTYDYQTVKTGIHKVVYVAMDETGNVACEEILFNVV